jgi:hypothetical protein
MPDDHTQRSGRTLVVPNSDPDLRIYLGPLQPSRDPRQFTPHHLPAYAHDPYLASERIKPIYTEANSILDHTPGADWWHIADADLIELAFPHWQIATVYDGPPETRKQVDPYAVLKARFHSDRWMLMLGYYRLLPGRGGTTPHDFRFTYHSNHNLAVVGTVDEILTALKKWRHPSSWQYTPRHVAHAISEMTEHGSPAHREAVHHLGAMDLMFGLTNPIPGIEPPHPQEDQP